MYLRDLSQEITGSEVPVTVKMDNQSSIKLARNGVHNRRSKHIDIRYHYLHEKTVAKEITLKYCPTNDQLADIFTKPLGKILFIKFRDQLMSP